MKKNQNNSQSANTVSKEDRALNLFAEMMIEKIEAIQTNWQKPWFTEGSLAQWYEHSDATDALRAYELQTPRLHYLQQMHVDELHRYTRGQGAGRRCPGREASLGPRYQRREILPRVSYHIYCSRRARREDQLR